MYVADMSTYEKLVYVSTEPMTYLYAFLLLNLGLMVGITFKHLRRWFETWRYRRNQATLKLSPSRLKDIIRSRERVIARLEDTLLSLETQYDQQVTITKEYQEEMKIMVEQNKELQKEIRTLIGRNNIMSNEIRSDGEYDTQVLPPRHMWRQW